MHSAFLLTRSGQIEGTKWATGSNKINHSKLKYKENKEIYQTDWIPNHLNIKYIHITTPNGLFCNFDLSTMRLDVSCEML